MEKEAVIQELATLENQLASSETQIRIYTEALDKQKSQVLLELFNTGIIFLYQSILLLFYHDLHNYFNLCAG